jgi:hypothetical protein
MMNIDYVYLEQYQLFHKDFRISPQDTKKILY